MDKNDHPQNQEKNYYRRDCHKDWGLNDIKLKMSGACKKILTEPAIFLSFQTDAGSSKMQATGKTFYKHNTLSCSTALPNFSRLSADSV
jgi:hypothetical protein